jgi:hypothetical protein
LDHLLLILDEDLALSTISYHRLGRNVLRLPVCLEYFTQRFSIKISHEQNELFYYFWMLTLRILVEVQQNTVNVPNDWIIYQRDSDININSDR